MNFAFHSTILKSLVIKTQRFSISLLVQNSGPKTLEDFPFQLVPSQAKVDIDLAKDDILKNLVFNEDMTMNGDVPWHGPREKGCEFM